MALRVQRRPLLGRVMLLATFGIAFGHIEAVVVVYIRRVLGWVPLPDDIGADALARVPGWLIHTEQTREAATVILLVAFAMLAGRIAMERLAAFLFALGACDLTYYASLRAMIGWPQSLGAQDCLFVIPRPWLAPVWLPMLIALGMIAVAVAILLAIERTSAGPPPGAEGSRRRRKGDS
jgi:hypothetical protein